MNKAKEYAEKFFLTVDHQGDVEEAYNDGYKQAEEDLELTWKDMVLFRTLFDATDANIRSGSIKIQPMTKDYYQEVLERFKDYKERKEK